MTYIQRLWRIEFVAISALVVVAGLVAVYVYTESVRVGEDYILAPAAAAKTAFLGVAAIGFLPVVLYGAPVYAWLANRGFANWPATLSVAIVPGVLALPFDPWLSSWMLGGGAAVAAITHVLTRRFTDALYR